MKNYNIIFLALDDIRIFYKGHFVFGFGFSFHWGFIFGINYNNFCENINLYFGIFCVNIEIFKTRKNCTMSRDNWKKVNYKFK
jgi:hypothetical protein